MEVEKVELKLYKKIIEVAERDWNWVVTLDEAEEMYTVVQDALKEVGGDE